jgi:hypothetical protein
MREIVIVKRRVERLAVSFEAVPLPRSRRSWGFWRAVYLLFALPWLGLGLIGVVGILHRPFDPAMYGCAVIGFAPGLALLRDWRNLNRE